MKKREGYRFSLLNRIVLFLIAFVAALVLQIGVSQYQTENVLKPMEERMSQIQSISAFLNDVEGTMQLLSDFRWDNGDGEALIASLEGRREMAEAHLREIDRELGQTSEAQYLLANAAATTHGTFSDTLDEIIALLKKGNPIKAAELYYSKAQPCGSYTRQYLQQLLEQAITDNQSEYVRLTQLNEKLKLIQTAALLLCTCMGTLVVISLLALLRLVREMSKASQAISRGELDTPDVDESRQDEIGQLAATFNEMKHSMQQRVQLLNEKSEMQQALHKKEREALELQTLMEREKLQQLRSQINPHFLFNTLNVIMHTARQEGAVQTNSLLGSLSKLFRYALASNEVQVPLSREVHIVNEYYALHRVRFGQRLNMRWDIDPEIELTETLVPSFILQPLVENAFKHGLGGKEAGGTVVLRVWPEESWLKIEVADDGVGMTEQRLRQVRENLAHPSVTGEHIGVYNVAARLRMCGEGCGLEIDSQEGVGTKVALRMKLTIAEEEDLDG